jgi:erythromycin esterase
MVQSPAIGVVYHPDRERWGNQLRAVDARRPPRRLIWCGDTTALEPVRSEPPDDPEPETAPTGV